MPRYDAVRQIQDDYQENTGDRPSRTAASVILDRMCDAFREQVEGVDVEYAVKTMPEIARHLMWRWTGEDGAKLRAAMEKLGVTQ